MDYSKRFEAMVSGAVDTWFSHANHLACSGLFPAFRLYYRPTDGKSDGALYLVPNTDEPDPQWVAAPLGDLPRNTTIAGMRSRIYDTARRLPILGHHDA